MRVRREFIKIGGLATLIQGLSSTDIAKTNREEKYSQDLTILNVALGLEHQAITAYQAAADSGLLSGNMLEMALNFQRDHKRHRDSIVKLIKHFGGTAVEPQQYDFGPIKTAEDILRLAHKLEQDAVDAYVSNAAKLDSSVILDKAVAILVDEVCHATNFKMALGLSVIDRQKY